MLCLAYVTLMGRFVQKQTWRKRNNLFLTCMRGHIDTWVGEEEGGKGSLPTGDVGMGRKSRLAGSLRQDESE